MIGSLVLLCLHGPAAPRAGAASGSPGATAPTKVGPLTWSDEFNTTGLDLRRSYRATGPRHDGILTPNAVSVESGVLTIKTYTEAGRHYSGMISTQSLGLTGFE